VEHIVERATEHKCLDRPGLASLIRSSYALVRHSARRILKDDAEAEDVAQEVFLRALRSEEADELVARPAWLHRVAVNLSLNRLRDERRRRELLAGYAQGGTREPPPDAHAMLRQVLGEVPEGLEGAVIRHYLQEESHQEIAAVMGVSRRTVGNRLAAFHAWLTARQSGG
jgi:RNA polymerase sigma-70 factor (ECF subfamily)